MGSTTWSQSVLSRAGARSVTSSAQTSVPHVTQLVPQAASQPIAAGSSVAMHYTERSPIRVRGNVTGRQYEFSSTQPVQTVDARDASSLLQSRFFRRV